MHYQLLALGLIFCQIAAAQDGLEDDFLDDVLEAVESPPAEQTPARGNDGLMEIADNLRKAAVGLERGDYGTETLNAQRSALEAMQELLAAAEQPNPEQDQNAEQQQERQQQTPQNDQDQTSAEEGTETPQAGDRPGSSSGVTEEVKVLLSPRSLLKEGVWGHLPEVVRDSLMSTSPEQYLPQFRDQIHRYYKGLAEGSSNP